EVRVEGEVQEPAFVGREDGLAGDRADVDDEAGLGRGVARCERDDAAGALGDEPSRRIAGWLGERHRRVEAEAVEALLEPRATAGGRPRRRYAGRVGGPLVEAELGADGRARPGVVAIAAVVGRGEGGAGLRRLR